MEESAFPRAREMHTSRRPKALMILILFLIVLSVLIFTGSRFLGGTGMDEQEEENNILPTAVIAPSSTPQPDASSQEADRSSGRDTYSRKK